MGETTSPEYRDALRALDGISVLAIRVADLRAEHSSEQIRLDGITRRPDPVPPFVTALRETIKYLKFRDDGADADYNREEELSRLWTEAGNAVRFYDPELANRCMIKGLGWADPAVWKRAESKGMKLAIHHMEASLDQLLRRGQDDMEEQKQVPSWFPMAGVGFAALTILFLMYLVVGDTKVDEGRRNILNLLLAFCVAASGAFLGGNAVAKGNIPFFKDSPVAFSAVGGVGIFVVVYLILWYTK